MRTHFNVFSLNWLFILVVSVVGRINECYQRRPWLIDTQMDDRRLRQLSLAIPFWVDATSTRESWDVSGHTARCTKVSHPLPVSSV